MDKIAEIIINSTAKQLNKVFHYTIPEDIIEQVKPGQLVEVPFGSSNKAKLGYVIGLVDTSPYEELKAVKSIVLDGSVKINKHMMELATWMAAQYMCNTSDCIKLMTPPVGGKSSMKKPTKDKNPIAGKAIQSSVAFKPNAEQQNAIEKISEAINKSKNKTFLLHGITGSGKTEVYLQVIANTIEQGKQAIVLVPEISLTPQMIQRFTGRFGENVAVLHSRLSEGERKDQWYRIKEGTVNVVVGARSAIFAPFDKLGVIIIDEEHEASYKSEKTPKYSAKEVAEKRGHLEKCAVVFGSATPSTETYYNSTNGEIELLELTERAIKKASLPTVSIIDMRTELQEGNRSIFSKELFSAIKKNLEEGNQTILFLNRRGYSSFILCRNCGFVAKCKNCSISMTYHSKIDRLVCHHCGYARPNVKKCPMCDSEYIRHFGVGTQRIEEEVMKNFSDARVIRMDMDTTSKKNSHEEILEKFRTGEADILIGTQMIAKGHDFPDVTLVGVISADTMLNIEDFRANERTFQLLTQVAGRAGRAEKEGKVIIQTYAPDSFSILSAKEQNYKEFYNQEIRLRKLLRYPPFCDMVTVILSGKENEKVKEFSIELESKIRSAFPKERDDVQFIATTSAPIARINNKYRWRIIIKCNMDDEIRTILKQVTKSLEQECARWCSVSLDVNPNSFM